MDYEEAECVITSTCEKGHGRIEERQVAVTNQLDWLDCRSKWKDLRSLIEVTSFRTVGNKITKERRFYISDLELTPELAVHLASSHWSIENHLDWIMDVNFGEDASLVSIANASEKLGALKRLAGTMIRIDLGGIRGTAQRRREADCDNSWTLRLLSRIFEIKL